MHPPHFTEPQVSSHFSTEPITCPYPEPEETIPSKETTFLSDSKTKNVCLLKRSLSFRHSYQGFSTYILSLENVPQALPISFFWLLLSTIFCIRLFIKSCVYFFGASGWENISNYLTLLRNVCIGRNTFNSWSPGLIR
jgi:hypothetical protein